MTKKRVSPHTIRHSTACHLLRASVDINTIRGWLGHVSLETTNIYTEIDRSMKADALSKCEVPAKSNSRGRWHQLALVEFLHSL
jgi:site-specific recombinase XerD